MGLLFLFYFFPAGLLALTPHSRSWYFFDVALLVYLYRKLIKDLADPAMFATFLIAVFPALVLKAVAIYLKRKEKFMQATYLPYMALLGPVLCLFFPQQVNELLAELLK